MSEAGPPIWTVDPDHTVAQFAARHLTIATVQGRLGAVRGTLRFDPEEPEKASVRVEIDVGMLYTGVSQRDDDLRSANFLDAANHPAITFESTGVEDGGEGSLAVHGDLTVRGQTRPVTLRTTYEGHVKDPWGFDRVGFSAHTRLDRREFGITYGDYPIGKGLMIGREIDVTLHLEAYRRS